MSTTDQALVDSAIDSGRGAVAMVKFRDQTLSFMGQFQLRSADGFVFHASFFPPEINADAIKRGLRATFICGASGAAIQFNSDILSIETSPIYILSCSHPRDIAATQRRANFRVPVIGHAPIELAVWKIPAHWVLRDKPKPSMQLRVEPADLSLGGMSVNILPHRLGPDSVAVGDRLRVDFIENEQPTSINAQVVYRSAPRDDGSVRAGVCFHFNPNSIESRRADNVLNRVIAAIQRQNIKFAAETSQTL